MRARGMMRLRNFIDDLLKEQGPMTTGEILDAYNQHNRHGTTMHILGNVLPKQAQKVGFIEKHGRARVRNVLWGAKEEA